MELQLQHLRKRAGYSQQEMADLLGVKKRTYASWERQEVGLNLVQACDIVDILNCTLDELAGRHTNKLRQYADQRQQRLNENYDSLSDKGRSKLAEHAEDLLLAESYSKNEEGDSVSESA